MNRTRKLLLLMLLLLIAAEVLLETNVTDKNKMLLSRLEEQAKESVYRVDCGECDELILPWRDDAGQEYLFLPSSAEKYDLIKDSNASDGPGITVMQSSEVASIFVILKNDTLEVVDGNKGYQAPAHVTIIDENGEVEYSKDLEYIKTRGNSTYEGEKKPYEIRLTHSKSLLGMSAAKEWILLTNVSDRSLLKNSLAQDFAANYTDLSGAVNKPADLYINGEYRGSYLLSEKVQVGDGYIEIDDLEKRNSIVNGETEDVQYHQVVEDGISYVAGISSPRDISGGYLVEMVPEDLLDGSLSWFYTNNGTLFRIKKPKYASKEEVCYIKGIFDEVELALSTEDGINPRTGRHYSEIIDVDTWVQKYLFELFFENGDMDYASMFYYKDAHSTDSKLYAGTPWDYDLCLQNTMGPDCFPYFHEMYLRKELLQFEEVQTAFEHTYETMFAPFIQEGLDAYLAQKEQEIAGTYGMNAIRWSKYSNTTKSYSAGYASLSANVDYLSKRLKASATALSNWIYDKDKYCVVSFPEAYQEFLVEKGTKTDFNLPIYADYVGLFDGWKDAEGHWYNHGAVVEKDMEYYADTLDLPQIFSADEAELMEMDFSRVSPELLKKMIVGLRKLRTGNQEALELQEPVVEVSGNTVTDEVVIRFLNYDGSLWQTLSVPRGSTLQQIPIPEWEDGIFVQWRRMDSAEHLDVNTYLLESTIYEAEWIYIPYLIENGLAISGKSIDEIDIEMLENVFKRFEE